MANSNAKKVMEQILAGKNVTKAISEGSSVKTVKPSVKKSNVAKKPVKKVAKMESKKCTPKKRVRKLFEECEEATCIICPVCGAESVTTRYNADTDETCFTCDECGNEYVLADATAFDLEEPITADNTDSISIVNDEGEVEVKVAEEAPVEDEAADVTAPAEEIESNPEEFEEGEFVEPTTPEEAAIVDAAEGEEPAEDPAVAAEEPANIINPDNWDDEGNFIGDPAEYDGEVVDYPYPTPILPEADDREEDEIPYDHEDDYTYGDDISYEEPAEDEEGEETSVGEEYVASAEEDDEDEDEEEKLEEQRKRIAARRARKQARR